ncbi:MAG: hypothetical protein AB7E47_02970 [Desulfovibrionaceae bacterium]
MAERFATQTTHVAGQVTVKDTQNGCLVCVVFPVPGREDGAAWVAKRLVELLNEAVSTKVTANQ